MKRAPTVHERILMRYGANSYNFQSRYGGSPRRPAEFMESVSRHRDAVRRVYGGDPRNPDEFMREEYDFEDDYEEQHIPGLRPQGLYYPQGDVRRRYVGGTEPPSRYGGLPRNPDEFMGEEDDEFYEDEELTAADIYRSLILGEADDEEDDDDEEENGKKKKKRGRVKDDDEEDDEDEDDEDQEEEFIFDEDTGLYYDVFGDAYYFDEAEGQLKQFGQTIKKKWKGFWGTSPATKARQSGPASFRTRGTAGWHQPVSYATR